MSHGLGKYLVPIPDAMTREHVLSVRDQDVAATRLRRATGDDTLRPEGQSAAVPGGPAEDAETERSDSDDGHGRRLSAEQRLRELVPTADQLIEPRLLAGCGAEGHDADCLCDVDLSRSTWDGTVAKRWKTEVAYDMVAWAREEAHWQDGREPTGQEVADFFDNLSAIIEMRDPVMRNRQRVRIVNYRYRYGLEPKKKAAKTIATGRLPKLPGHHQPDVRPFGCGCGEDFDRAANRKEARLLYRDHITRLTQEVPA